MATQDGISIAHNWTVTGRSVFPASRGDAEFSGRGVIGGRPEGQLEIVVLHTTTAETLAALRAAGTLAQGLAAKIRLLVVQVVPFPLPVSEPSVNEDFTQRRFRTLAGESAIDTEVDICLCRDRWELLDSRLAPGSVVVIGCGRLPARKTGRWHRILTALGLTAEGSTVKRLKRRGHHVVVCPVN